LLTFDASLPANVEKETSANVFLLMFLLVPNSGPSPPKILPVLRMSRKNVSKKVYRRFKFNGFFKNNVVEPYPILKVIISSALCPNTASGNNCAIH
jgi:hypothetical protein